MKSFTEYFMDSELKDKKNIEEGFFTFNPTEKAQKAFNKVKNEIEKKGEFKISHMNDVGLDTDKDIKDFNKLVKQHYKISGYLQSGIANKITKKEVK